jgi:hypothetical protein
VFRAVGTGGYIFKDQVTQPELADYALRFTTRPLGFLDHPTALIWDVAILSASTFEIETNSF